MQLSTITRGAAVTFPEFTGERIYMRRFERSLPLPADLQRWQGTVDAMLFGVRSEGPCYLMIDQKAVRAGEFHRRSGLHVDWYWHEGLQAHGGKPSPGHIPSPPGHRKINNSNYREAIVLASNSLGCRAYCGKYDGDPLEDGDTSHIEVSGLEVLDMEPGRSWICDTALTLHESIPALQDSLRTVVRINVAGWMPGN